VIFTETKLKGAFIIEPERLEDERGFFARTFCEREFAQHGLRPRWVQCNISFNKLQGTLRGMHYQAVPRQEIKLVRCSMGSIYDVIIDLRSDSPTYKQHVGLVLSAENRKMLYIPEGLAHGLLTLEDGCEVFYEMSEFYEPSCARGVRWSDPAFAIPWPQPVRLISERDQRYPDF